MRRIRKGASVLTAAVLTATGLGVASGTAAPKTTAPEIALPAPFSEWNVSVEPAEDDDRVLEVQFDSPLIGERVTNRVYLPDSYRERGPAMPVLYYLHGTVLHEVDNPALDPVTGLESLLHMASSGGGYHQTQLMRFESQLDRAKFVVVAPDTDKDHSWCHNCGWVDGRSDIVPNVPPATGELVPADSFLHEELYPLVEHLFNVRTDRAGRGVSGFSMGGWSAMLQGMKHPDDYGFIGSVSGVYEILTDPQLRPLWEVLGYQRDQGFGTSVTHEIWWRNYNPSDLATNLSGTGTKFLLSYGDACLSTAAVDSADCAAYPPLRHPLAFYVEQMLNGNNRIAEQDLAAKGIPVQVVELPGIHGANNHRVYADHMVEAANRAFARGVPTPKTFSYRTVNPRFEVWGYHVRVRRSADEFLAMTGARTNGRGLTVIGTGAVEVTTPARFTPGRTYRVIATAEDGSTSQHRVTADRRGRVTAHVDLGSGNLLPQLMLTDALGTTEVRSTTVRIG
jgi:hypothetical protein